MVNVYSMSFLDLFARIGLAAVSTRSSDEPPCACLVEMHDQAVELRAQAHFVLSAQVREVPLSLHHWRFPDGVEPHLAAPPLPAAAVRWRASRASEARAPAPGLPRLEVLEPAAERVGTTRSAGCAGSFFTTTGGGGWRHRRLLNSVSIAAGFHTPGGSISNRACRKACLPQGCFDVPGPWR